MQEVIYGSHLDEDEECSEAFKNNEYPPIIIRQEKTPSPIIVEKYVKKKAPQVIIKEIHVQEPAPPPIKVVEKMDGTQEIFSEPNSKLAQIYQAQNNFQDANSVGALTNPMVNSGQQTINRYLYIPESLKCFKN